MQREHLEEIGRRFGDRVAAVVPTYPREPKGMEMLARVSEDLMQSSAAMRGLVGAAEGRRR
jgi:arsenite/tail-anchored protein-transporting ATPase